MKLELFIGKGTDHILLTPEGMIDQGILAKFHNPDCEYAIGRNESGATIIALRRKGTVEVKDS